MCCVNSWHFLCERTWSCVRSVQIRGCRMGRRAQCVEWVIGMEDGNWNGVRTMEFAHWEWAMGLEVKFARWEWASGMEAAMLGLNSWRRACIRDGFHDVETVFTLHYYVELLNVFTCRWSVIMFGCTTYLGVANFHCCYVHNIVWLNF
jgi:hypothetical protein